MYNTIKQIYKTILLSLLVFTTGAFAADVMDPNPEYLKLCEDQFTALKLDLYYTALKSASANQEPVKWKSQALKDRRIKDTARALEIISLILNENPTLINELNQFIKDLGGMTNPAFWNKYFRSYDQTVGFNDGFTDVLFRMNAYLPTMGQILDIGAGTGNGSLLLSLLAPDRQFHAIDPSSYGLNLAERKIRANRGNFLSFQQSLLDYQSSDRADGAVMNNVLYTIPDKEAALRHIFHQLKPGARLLLSDPIPSAAMTVESARLFASHYVRSIIQNGSEMTEFDLALIARLNFGALMKESHFLGPAKIIEMAEGVGFTYESTESSYKGLAALIVLRKP